MAIKFDFYTIPDPDDPTKEIIHIRSVMDEPLSTNQMTKGVEKGNSITRSDTVAVMSALGSMMGSEFEANRRFHMTGIGTFGITLRVKKGTKKDIATITSKDIEIGTIIFQPDKSLLAEIRSAIQFKRNDRPKHSPRITDRKLIDILTAYFAKNEELTRKGFEELIGFTRTTALRRLRVLTDRGILVNVGSRHEGRYRLPKSRNATPIR